MEALIFTALFIALAVLAPIFGADSRPEFREQSS